MNLNYMDQSLSIESHTEAHLYDLYYKCINWLIQKLHSKLIWNQACIVEVQLKS